MNYWLDYLYPILYTLFSKQKINLCSQFPRRTETEKQYENSSGRDWVIK